MHRSSAVLSVLSDDLRRIDIPVSDACSVTDNNSAVFDSSRLKRSIILSGSYSVDNRFAPPTLRSVLAEKEVDIMVKHFSKFIHKVFVDKICCCNIPTYFERPSPSFGRSSDLEYWICGEMLSWRNIVETHGFAPGSNIIMSRRYSSSWLLWGFSRSDFSLSISEPSSPATDASLL